MPSRPERDERKARLDQKEEEAKAGPEGAEGKARPGPKGKGVLYVFKTNEHLTKEDI